MHKRFAIGGDAETKRVLAILRLLFGRGFADGFAVTLWNGVHVPSRTDAHFTFLVNAPFALRAAFFPPIDLNPGRAFAENWIDIQGDVVVAVDRIIRAIGELPKRNVPLLLGHLLQLPRPPGDTGANGARLVGRLHSKARDAAAIGFHYNQPIAFYQAFLDEEMVYSCGYFDEGVETLGEAQIAKIDYILRKIRLQPGEKLLDIGCGWGALVIRAAEHFGAQVVGITLSREQHAQGLRRIARADLAGRAAIEFRDYRDLAGRSFDKIVSVGMVEHVGREQLSAYFAAAYRALRPGGLFLNHGIAEQHNANGYRVSGFIGNYVFPDADLLRIADMMRWAERAGFEVRDVENLREHYGRTLRAWLQNLESNREAAIAAAGERTYRIWRLYLAGSAQGFTCGRMGLFQTLLAKRTAEGNTPIPATRRDLYARS